MKSDILGYVLLPVAVVGVFGGIHTVSGGEAIGWLGIGLGLLLAAASYATMKPGAKLEAPAEQDQRVRDEPTPGE